jgi:hypothetical protein
MYRRARSAVESRGYDFLRRECSLMTHLSDRRQFFGRIEVALVGMGGANQHPAGQHQCGQFCWPRGRKARLSPNGNGAAAQETTPPQAFSPSAVALGVGRLSFPKIISGHIGGAARPIWERRRCCQIAGLPDVTAHFYPVPGACAPDCNRLHRTQGYAAGAAHQRSASDPDTRAVACRSGAPHSSFATATPAELAGHECPWPGAGA